MKAEVKYLCPTSDTLSEYQKLINTSNLEKEMMQLNVKWPDKFCIDTKFRGMKEDSIGNQEFYYELSETGEYYVIYYSVSNPYLKLWIISERAMESNADILFENFVQSLQKAADHVQNSFGDMIAKFCRYNLSPSSIEGCKNIVEEYQLNRENKKGYTRILSFSYGKIIKRLTFNIVQTGIGTPPGGYGIIALNKLQLNIIE